MSGQAFEFTPGGVLPLAEPVTTGVINAAAAVAQIRASAQATAPTTTAHAPARAQASAAPEVRPVSQRTYKAQIRARLRVLERAIRGKAALEREAADLRRMLAAAQQPPATVANIHRARSSG